MLRAVVEDYVLTAIPVGSKALVHRYGLGVSPATVRSAMAELEALGLLTHPHTSAGRVPSDLGYRLYVEALMREAELDMTDRLTIRHQFSQVSLTSNDWLRLAASVLAGKHACGIGRDAGAISTRAVRPCPARGARRRHAPARARPRRRERPSAPPRPAALERELPEEPVDQAALDAAAAALNAELAGLTAPQARRRAPKLSPLAARIGEVVAAMLEGADSVVVEDVFTDGIGHVLEQPEFAEGSKLRPILEILQRSDFLQQLVPVLTRSGGVHVIIGRENTNDAMHEVSLVFAPYGAPDRALGLLGVLGPTRMRYPRAIPTVRYLSTLMNELISSEYGETQ